MNNKLINRIVLAFLVLFMTSCNDDYLETTPTQLLSADDIAIAAETRPELLDGYLNGLYATMYTAGSGGTTGHDDFGQRGYDIFTDMLQGDMVLGGLNYGWYSGISNHSVTTDYQSVRNYTPWRYNYRIILGANTIIDGFDLEDLPTAPESRHNLGQALSMRAYSYYNLVNLYATDNMNPSLEAIPLYTEVTEVAAPKSTVGEVYNVIINDLELAVELLDGYNRGLDKFRVNQNVARGLLANAYASVGRNAESAEVALAVINSGEFPLTTKLETAYDSATGTGGGFNDVTTPSWMWGVDLTEEMSIGLVSWWGQVDRFTYSYAWAGDTKVINNDLYDAMPSDDVRRKQFVGFGNKTPTGKFYAPCREAGCQDIVTTDYVYMRMDEIQLLYAETAAKSGNEAGAKQALKDLLDLRVDDSSYVDGLSGQALIDEILLQQRLELWGEGKVYFSMKRNQATVTYASNHLYYPGDSFEYNADVLTFEIPLSEVQNNPNISN